MEIKLVLFLVADLAMIVAGIVYGMKFLRRKNHLLGIEWLIMATSGTNFLLYALTGVSVLYDISYFFDAFSRAFGFPVIAVVGLMAVSHDYHLTGKVETTWFIGSVVATIFLITLDGLEPFRPYFFLVMSTGFAIYLGVFAYKLWQQGEAALSAGVTLALLCCQAVATIYDFIEIPGDDSEHTLFYIGALSTWGFTMVVLYYGYCAFERSGAMANRQAAASHSPS